MIEIQSARDADRRSAIRSLLASPLLLEGRDSEAFRRVSRHSAWLIRWFDENPGWRLSVEPGAGFARLCKIPPKRAGARAARTRAGLPFDRRRYVLLSLALSSLSELAGQTTVRQLADLVREAGEAEGGLEPFEPDRGAERRALVDALLFLADQGVLRARDGDAEGYVRNPEGDALYDVNDRLLVHFLGSGEELLPETEEGRKIRARHEVFRAVLDEPVLYLEDLGAEAREWFNRSSGWLYERLSEDAGLIVERRLEGLATIDPAGEVSDELFPDGGSTVKHAALLLAEQIAEPARRHRDIGLDEVERIVGLLLSSYSADCGWSRQYPCDAAGAANLAADAMALLERFGLARRGAAGWRALPAVARIQPGAPGDGTSEEIES
jgi:uncharacterized protein (TIGR02678 family)